jgi:NAD(P)-dependent dehydrogenase (short-subunit alcohol dehydrogenase family)
MEARLKGKAILLVGAGGIGDELARRYAHEGASVLIGDIDGGAAMRVADEIVAAGGAAIGAELDGAQESAVIAAVARARVEFGGLDGLHANFTHVFPSDSACDVTDIPLEDYDAAMATNTRGYLLCTRHAIPAILERGGGAILYTSSDSAYIGEPMRVAYAMSKSAIHALMRHVASRFGPRGVRANVIALGLVWHAKLEQFFTPERVEQAKAANLLKTRLGKPADIAAMAALLMADEGAFVTGQIVSVNGGQHLRP